MEPSEEKQKRKVHRSPSYPAFDLVEAITKADAIYKNERRSATTPEVLAAHMGYSAAVGPGGRAVSALRQYGLIEENGGKYRLSDIGYTLIHFDHSSDEWKAAVSEASRRPTLFRELLEEYPDGLPSDGTLRNDLLKREFNPASIADVVAIFRSTMSLAETGDLVHNGSGGNDTPMQTNVVATPETGSAALRGRTMAETQQLSGHAPPVPSDRRQDVFSLTEGPVTIQWPATISAESFEDLGDWLDILKRKIGRSVAKGEAKED